MENRILFDAAPGGAVEVPEISPEAWEPLAADPAVDSAEPVPNSIGTLQTADQASRRELVIVDTTVDNFQQLVDGIAAGESGRQLEIVAIDGNSDGLQAISEILAGQNGLDAVHLVTHGTDAALQLGNVWLSLENLSDHSSTLAHWSRAFASDGDLLLYGCHLGDSADGRQLVNSIAALTAADVAASVDPTGYGPRGGDWELEYQVGSIEAQAALSGAAQQSWNGILAVGPNVSLNVPAEVSLGENVNLSLTFSNTGASGEIGYGPYVDILLSHLGSDGVYDGAGYTSAPDGLDIAASGAITYLGQPLTYQVITFGDDDGAFSDNGTPGDLSDDTGAGALGVVPHPYFRQILNETQLLSASGSVTGGTYTLTYNAETTAALAFNAGASTVQAALESLASISAGDVSVTGGPLPGSDLLIEFTGSLAQTDVTALAVDDQSLVGGYVNLYTLADGDPASQAIPVYGVAGQKLVVAELPFGSFTPEQPAAVLDVTLSMSNLADVANPLAIRSRAGFRFGATPQADADTDPSLVSDPQSNSAAWVATGAVTPTLLEISKSYSGPEQETATGPNYVRQWTVDLKIPDGQTIDNLDLFDDLPSNVVFVSLDSITSVDGSTNFTTNVPLVGNNTTWTASNGMTQVDVAAPQNNQFVAVTADSITGTSAASDVTFRFSYYVDETDADSNRVIPSDGEDDSTSGPDSRSRNNARAVGDWTPLDGRDAGGVDNAAADPGGFEDTVDDKSLAVQESLTVVDGDGTPVGGLAHPADLLRYTITFQISDYYTFGDLVLTDTLSDGQRFYFAAGFEPTFTVGDFNAVHDNELFAVHLGGENSAPGAPASANFIVDRSQIDNSDNAGELGNGTYSGGAADPTDGSTTITIELSEALGLLVGEDGILQGGLTNGAGNLGPTTGTITFYAQVQDEFSDSFPSGDRSVDQGDALSSVVSIAGSVRQNEEDNGTAFGTIGTEDDGSGASITVEQGTLSKSIYAINGSTSLPGGMLQVAPGDTVTYRVRYTLPSSDFEGLTITDFLPLPVFDADDPDADDLAGPSWVLNLAGSFDALAPAAGVVEFGPNDTFFNSAPGTSDYLDGSHISVDASANSLIVSFGNYDNPAHPSTEIDLLYTVTVGGESFADGLLVTNIVRAEENTTNSGLTTVDSIAQVQIRQPGLLISKGVVSTSVTEAQRIFATSIPLGLDFIISFDGQSTNPISILDGAASVQAKLEALTNIGPGNVAVTGGPIMLGLGVLGQPFVVEFQGTFAGNNVAQMTTNDANIQVSTLGEGSSFGPSPAGPIAFQAPGSSGPAFTAPFDSGDLAATPVNSDVSGLDAGDLVKFAVVLENTGGGAAYDLIVSDLLPAGLEISGSAQGLNLEVRDGDGNSLSWTGLDTGNAADLFGSGIQISDSITAFLASHGSSQLTRMDSRDNFDASNNEAVVGAFGISGVRALARDPLAGSIYASAAGQLGSVDLLTGAFAAVGGGFGTASGSVGPITLSNVDGLAFHPLTGQLYGIHVRPADSDLLFQIDTLSGAHVSGVFGGADYIEVDAAADIADIAIDTAGRFYATTRDRLIRLDLDESGAAAAVVDVGAFASGITDMAGLDADRQGRLWGTTGDADGGNSNRLWEISRTTGAATNSRQLDDGSDYEGLAVFDPNAAGAINSSTAALASADGSNIIVVTYDLQLADSVEPNEMISNQAALNHFASVDGGNNHAPVGVTANSTVGVANVAAQSSIVATSELHTGETGGIERVAIGEIVRYRIVVELPEGTATNFQIRDKLPGGLTFLDDGTATVAVVLSDTSNFSSSTLAGIGLSVVGDGSLIESVTPTFTMPDDGTSASTAIHDDNYTSGRDVFFKLGDLTNSDNDADREYVVVEFNALVDNSNGSTRNDAGESRYNDVEVYVGGSEIFDLANAARPRVVIAEPSISSLQKQVSDGAGGWVESISAIADDEITFRLTFGNGTGNNISAAFDLRVTDTLPAEYTLDTTSVEVRINSILQSDGGDFSDSTAGNDLDLLLPQIDPGDSVEIIYKATLKIAAEPSETVPNTASIVFTSLLGDFGTNQGPNNATNSDLQTLDGIDTSDSGEPGITYDTSSGASHGERNGSGAAGGGSQNDHHDADGASVVVPDPTFSKVLLGTELDHANNASNEAVIGELVSYRLTLTLPQGTSTNTQIVDTLDSGLAFVAMDGANTSVSGATISGSTTPTVTNSGQTLTFDLGTVQDNDLSNGTGGTITISYDAVVLNVSTNQGTGPSQLNNSAALTWSEGGPLSRSAANVTVIEPQVSVGNSVEVGGDGNASGDAGDAVVYTLTFTNSSNVDAYDVLLSDALATGGGGASLIVDPVFGVADNASSGTTVSAADFELVGSNGAGWVLQSKSGSDFDMLATQLDGVGQPRAITFTISGTLATAASPNQVVPNTANARWTSLDGDVSSARSIHHAESTERDGSNAGDNTHDYVASGSANVTVIAPAFTKSLISTDQTETSGSQVTIGERVTYGLLVHLPEGTTPSAAIVDLVPAGLDYTGFQLVTTVGGSSGLLTADFAGTIQAGDPTISGGSGSGSDVTFSFGQIDVAVDNDTTNNAFLLVVEAVVLDLSGNVGYGGSPTALSNSATVDISGDGVAPQASNSVVVTVVESNLAITKEYGGGAANVDKADAGDSVTIELTVENTGAGDAFDVEISDTLNSAHFDFSTVDLGSAATDYPADFGASFTSGSGLIQYSGGTIAAGATVTFTISVDLSDTVNPAQVLSNSATITQATTLSGTVAGERDDADPDGNGSDTASDTVTVRRNSLAGSVYFDADNDGTLDGGETGVGGVTIRLQGTDHLGNSVDTSTATLGNGSYLFDNLRPGTYSLTETQPGTHFDGIDTIGTPGGTSANDKFTNIVLPAGSETFGSGNNFGELEPSSLSGSVYHDADNDGVRDGGEAGIGGVQVRLTGLDDLGAVVDTTVATAGDGSYSFGSLRPSDSSGYTISELAQPAGHLDGVDSDGSLGNGDAGADDVISSINLAAGQDGTAYGFGELRPSSLSGYVYHDSDNDGDRGDEPAGSGIQSVGVSLTGTDDRGNGVNLSTTTDADGLWQFSGLRPSNGSGYLISETQPGSHLDGIDTIGTQGGTSGADQFSSVVVSDTSGTENNFGELEPASIAGTVFNDSDNDGIQDPGEPGISGVTVTLSGFDDRANAVSINRVTDANGDYEFTDLRPSGAAGYSLTETQPANYNDGLHTDGSLANGDTAANDVTSSINVGSGSSGTGYDFGERGAAISGITFIDDDRDGVLDGGEANRLGGVTVELYDSAGAMLLATTVTAGDGSYLFEDLAADDYQIRQTQPSQYTSTSPDTLNVTLPLGGLPNQHFGEALWDLGNTVWFDANSDGVLDAGEPGLAGVDVTLVYAGPNGIFGDGDDTTSNTATGAAGDYQFNELFNGAYRVSIDTADLPAAVLGTAETDDSSAAIDGTSHINIGGSDRFDVDFGYSGSGTIGDFVWLDVDHDGSQDVGEPGLADLTVDLTFAGKDGTFGNGDDFSLTVVTSAAGAYSFQNLPAGEFRIRVDSADADLPSSVVGVDGPQSISGTANLSLVAGQTNNAIDFGFAGTLSLGDRLWLDQNGDGAQDPGEPGIPEVQVNLLYAGQDGIFGGSDDVTLVDTSGPTGSYGFANLADGNYRISYQSAELPAALAASFEVDGSANNQADVTLAGSDRTDVDFGFQGAGSLGDFVWLDVDGDGTQDGGEPGLDNITVDLTFAGADGIFGNADDILIAEVTAAAGGYAFAGMPDGDYRIAVDTSDSDLPGSLAATSGPQSIAGTANVSLSPGNRTQGGVDFGFEGTNTVGDSLWFDANGDGVQDPAEPGLGNVDLTLSYAGQDNIFGNADDVTIATVTAADGSYAFSGLADGGYRLAVDTADLPDGVTQTFELNDGADTLADTAEFSVSGASRTEIDFAYIGARSLGDRVWYDGNGDGVQDGVNEPGWANVDVTLLFAGSDGLFGNDDDFVLQTATDAAGSYSFDNLPEGDFRLSLDLSDLPGGVSQTFEVDSTNDNQANLTIAGSDRSDADFGYRGNGILSDLVWYDADGDGIVDAGEPGLPNVDLSLEFAGSDGLFGNDDDLTLATSTDQNGTFGFANLPAGQFRVEVTSEPAGTTPTLEVNDGPDNLAGVAEVGLVAGQTRNDVDFGFSGTGSIGDRIFLDLDGNGVQDAGEPGYPGVSLALEIDFDQNGSVDHILSTQTDQDGDFLFSNLPAVDYEVVVTQPGGTTQTLDPDAASDNRSSLTLAAAEANTVQDFAYQGVGSIGDRIFWDADADAVADAGEPGLPAIGIGLEADLDQDGGTDITFTTATDASGAYIFNGLPVGEYTLSVAPPPGTTPTVDADGLGTPHQSITVLGASENQSGQDFGYRGNGSIGEGVFWDTDNSGSRDAEDFGLPGVDVTLMIDVNGDSSVDYLRTVTTDGNGAYSIGNLIPGDYTISVAAGTVPGGLGANPTFDGDGASTANTSGVTLGVDQANTLQNFGYTGTASLGDFVWLDINADGAQDGGNELGLGNVDVTLIWFGDDGVFGTADDELLSVATDDGGNYGFGNLPSGLFRVDVVDGSVPAGSILTTGNDTHDVSLSDGQDHSSSDFGYRGVGSIGDRVFFDYNGDGSENGDDVGYPGVVATITSDIDGDGNDEVLTSSTDAAGNYAVAGLPEGTYVVTLTPPAGTAASFDADGLATPNRSVITLGTSAPSSSDQDFGLTGTGTVGGTIFFDPDGNGNQDAGQAGIPAVTVTIEVDLDGDGNPDFNTTTVTDQSGDYSFTTIPQGEVTLAVTSPGGSAPSTDHDGSPGGDASSSLNLSAGVIDHGQSFGFIGTGSIGNLVFWDPNANGLRDSGETGLPNAALALDIDFNRDGNFDHTLLSVSAADGSYSFANLVAGDHRVRITLPAGTSPTFDADGIATPNQSFLTLAAGENNTDQRFGYRGTGSIGQRVFFDYRGDGGVFHAADGDRGMPGVNVTIATDVNGDSVVDYTRTVLTDAAGHYAFENLIPGPYTITVDPSDLPDLLGDNATYDSDGVAAGSQNASQLVLAAGQDNTGQDFGYHATPDYSVAETDGLVHVTTGQTVAYTLTLRNDGTLFGRDIVVTDAFPTNILSNVTASDGGIVDAGAGTITWNASTTADLAVLDVGEQVTLTVTGTVVAILDGANQPLVNSAAITDDAFNGIDPNLANNSVQDIDHIADITALKNVLSVAPVGDNWNVAFELLVENTGSAPLGGLTLFDDLISQFGTALVGVSTPTIDATGMTLGGTAPPVNSGWTGDTGLDIFDPGFTAELLMPGERIAVRYVATLDPDVSGSSSALNNRATAGGSDGTTDPGNVFTVSDISDSGGDPTSINAGAPGDAGTESDATPLYVPDIAAALQQSAATQDPVTHNWLVPLVLRVENVGTVSLDSLSLTHDVAAQLGETFVAIQPASLAVRNFTGSGAAPTVNTNWASDTTAGLIASAGVLLHPGESFEVEVTVEIDPDRAGGLSQPLEMQAVALGRGLNENGLPLQSGGSDLFVVDASDSGSDANGTNPTAAGDSGSSDDASMIVIGEVGVAKRLISAVETAVGGNRDLTYELVVRNLGTVALTQLTLSEDLDEHFPNAFAGVSTMPVMVSSTAAMNPTLNSAWDGNLAGAGDPEIFSGADGLLQPGEHVVVRFTIDVDIDQLSTGSSNQAVAGGFYDATPAAAGGHGVVSDLSDIGTNPGGTNPGFPGDTGGFDDPTLIPAIGIAKQHGDPLPVGENFVVPVALFIENLGATDLNDLRVFDDLAAAFGPAFLGASAPVVDNSGLAIPANGPRANAAWPADSSQSLLDGTGLLLPGDRVVITFEVLLDPDVTGSASPLSNQAVARAADPDNPTAVVQDLSDSGTDPALSNPAVSGDTGSADDPTPVEIADAGLVKRISNATQLGLSFHLTTEMVVENTGTVDLADLQLNDDVADQYGANYSRIVSPPRIVRSTATGDPMLNPSYVADTSQNLFDGLSGLLRPGESITIEFVVEVVAVPGQSEATLVNSAEGGGSPLNVDGFPLTDGSGTPLLAVLDDSDSGTNPNSANAGAPGDSGATGDATPQSLTFFTFDAFNDFSSQRKGLWDQLRAGDLAPAARTLSHEITQLAPEPILSGSARPGSQIVGRVYDSGGALIGETFSFADAGGNWLMQFYGMPSLDHARFEIIEISGGSGAFTLDADIYGYLGNDVRNNDYASLGRWTPYGQQFDLSAVYRRMSTGTVEHLHQSSHRPLGFGRAAAR